MTHRDASQSLPPVIAAQQTAHGAISALVKGLGVLSSSVKFARLCRHELAVNGTISPPALEWIFGEWGLSR